MLGLPKVVSGRTTTVLMATTSVREAALNANGTMTQIIIRERELSAHLGMVPVHPLETIQLCPLESAVSLMLLLAIAEQVERQGLPQGQVGALLPAGLASTAPTAGVHVDLGHQSLVMNLGPGRPLLWPVWFTGTFTEKTGHGVASGHFNTVAAALPTWRIREILLPRGWQARLVGLHAPTVSRAPAAALQVQTRSAAPAAAQVAGESFLCFFSVF